MATCPSCGADNPQGFRFCGSCGAQLEVAGTEERKVVTVLFVDLVGFTTRADRADPEDVRAILRPYHALLRREIDRWGGTLEKFVGDAAMAVFGAPIAHEDDPERAVRAALRIVEALPDLNQEYGLDLEVRAGIDTGEALVTLGARASEGEAMVAGDVVNTAARLQSSAPIGGIAVGETTYGATSGTFEYEELEPVRLKGKAELVALWRAIATRASFGTDLEHPATPFVGREDDLAVLQQAFRRTLRERSIQLVTVVGEPGVGKTRLVTELSGWIDDQPEIVFWRQGRCLPYGDGVTFWALAEIVKAHAGILESDDATVARGKLAEVIDAVNEDPRDRGWLVAALGALVGVESDRALERGESFAAWRTFLEAVATRRPLVLVFDDLHWADEGLIRFLDELLDRSTGAPLLVVCTARPELFERLPDWGGGKRNSSTVGLSPLSDEDTAVLIAGLLRQAVLPAETQRLLLDQAGGNPLFAEEFTKMLVDQGTLTRVGGTWTIAGSATIAVPDSVHAIIAARLDTLPADRKSLLQDAAVVGKVFWSGAVARMAETDEARVREVMHDLARMELIREARRSTVDGQAQYAFWHALIRDVAYGQLPRGSRIARHRAAASWIEQLAETRVEDATELLAYHHTTALDLARTAATTEGIADLEESARRSLVSAGDRVRHLDPPKAETYYRRALDLTPEAHDEHPAILVKLLDTTMLSIAESERVFEEAVAGFRAQGDLHGVADAMARFSPLVWRGGDLARSLRLGREAVDLLEQERAASPDLAFAYSKLAFRLLMTGDTQDGLKTANAALALADELDLPIVRQDALQHRGMARFQLGDLGGLEDLRQALRLGIGLGLANGTEQAYVNLSDFVWPAEGPAAARSLRLEAIELWQRRGLGLNDWALGELCWFLFDMGEWDELLEAAETALEFEADVGERRQPGAMALTMRSLVQVHRGRVELAAGAVPEIRARIGGSDRQVVLPGLATCAVIQDRRGDHEGAKQLLAGFAEACRPERAWIRAWCLEDVARVATSVGMTEVARDLCDDLEVVATRDRLSLLSALAHLREADGDLEGASAMHAEAVAGWHDFGNVPEEAFSTLAVGRCLVQLERQEGAAARLAEARRIFEKLGASPYIAEIDELLGRESV